MKLLRFPLPGNKLIRITLFILLIQLSADVNTTFSEDNIYFVATNGNDNNPGAETQPFATLQKALNIAAAGDTINIRGGVYNLTSTIYTGLAGTPDAWITIQAYQEENPVFDCSQTESSTSCLTLAGEYIELRGIEVRYAQKSGISGWNGKNLKIMDNSIHHSIRSGIWVGHSESGVVTDILISGNTLYENCQTNNPPLDIAGGWPPALEIRNSTNVTLTKNYIHHNFGEGIALITSDSLLVSENILHDNVSINIYLDGAADTIVEKNLSYTTNDARFYRFDLPANGITIANEWHTPSHPPHHNILRNNLVLNSGRKGISYGNFEDGGGLQNTWIVNNTLYQSSQSLISIDDDAHNNTVIANNIFYQETADIASVPADLSGLNFHHNLWYGGTGEYPIGDGDVTSNPLFISPGTNDPVDYCIQVGSPAINAGESISEVFDDFFSTARSDGAYDLGACERRQHLIAPLLMLLLNGK